MQLPLVGETSQADVALVVVLSELGWQHAGDHPATLVPTDLSASGDVESAERRESEADKTPDEQELLENAQQTACHEAETNGECHAEVDDGECHAEVDNQERTTNAWRRPAFLLRIGVCKVQQTKAVADAADGTGGEQSCRHHSVCGASCCSAAVGVIAIMELAKLSDGRGAKPEPKRRLTKEQRRVKPIHRSAKAC